MSGRVIVKKDDYCYMRWKVKDFTLKSQKDHEAWQCPKFYFSNVWWSLRRLVEETSDESTQHLALYLVRVESDSDVGEKTVCFTLGLKAKDGRQYKSQRHTHSFVAPGDYYGSPKLIETDELVREKDKLWPDNVVTFFCEIYAEIYSRTVDGESLAPSYSDLTSLCPEFKNLVSRGKKADVTIKVKNREFSVHSKILAARSPVFASMLKHQMKEEMIDTINIPDCDPGTFLVLLMFLYTGHPNGLSANNARQLYVVAGKYNIMNLKKYCVDFMCENISEQDVCDVLSLAVMHNDKELLAHGADFFLNHIKKILQTIKWITFFKEHPVEATELLLKALDAK